MGNTLSAFKEKFFKNINKIFSTGRKHTVTMIGLDASGKTTLLYRIKTGDIQHTVPTIGFNCETVDIEDLTFQVWDIGGQEVFIKFWHNYIKTSSAIIYLVDLADKKRFEQASDALWSILKGTNTNKPLLVLANKAELLETDMEKDNALNTLVDIMHLDKYTGPKNIVPCSVKLSCDKDLEVAKINSKIILGAFRWLSTELKKLPSEF